MNELAHTNSVSCVGKYAAPSMTGYGMVNSQPACINNPVEYGKTSWIFDCPKTGQAPAHFKVSPIWMHQFQGMQHHHPRLFQCCTRPLHFRPRFVKVQCKPTSPLFHNHLALAQKVVPKSDLKNVWVPATI